MNDFGLVTEGESDQVVIERILFGFFENPDLLVTQHHPRRDETFKDKTTGGWGNLIEYLKSTAFQRTFEEVQFVIIHIDTDKSEEYGVSKRDANGELTVEALIDRTTLKIIEWIGDFYFGMRERIIFAISVHEIECWLLPLYYSDSKRSKTTGCINTLNQILPQKEGFSIHAKEYRYYEKMAKPFLKRKELNKCFPHNPSFAVFVSKLEQIRLDPS
jgi:hypothetical protein